MACKLNVCKAAPQTHTMDVAKIHVGRCCAFITCGLASRHKLTAPRLTGLWMRGEQRLQVRLWVCKQMKENTFLK